MTRLSALLFALAALPVHADDPHHHHHAPAETRQALPLSDEEAAHIRMEMRAFLSGVQQIVSGAARNDMAGVATAARALGVAAAHEVPADLRRKLPLEFKRLGNATHTGFDDLARDAASMADPNLAMQQLGQVMRNCVTCHATFHIRPTGR